MNHFKNILCNALRAILLVAILFSYGGGSTLLQGVAWISMFAGEMENEVTVEQALKNTFDGHKPCDLCHAAGKLRASEQEVPAPNNNDQAPVKSAPKKLSDGFIFSEKLVPNVQVSECSRGWMEFSKSWPSWLLIDVVTPPPQSV